MLKMPVGTHYEQIVGKCQNTTNHGCLVGFSKFLQTEALLLFKNTLHK